MRDPREELLHTCLQASSSEGESNRVFSTFLTPALPEQWRNETVTPKTDVYAFGILLWELWTKQVPWQNKQPHAIQAEMSIGNRLEIPDVGVPLPIAKLIRQCWLDEPSCRPDMYDVLLELINFKRITTGKTTVAPFRKIALPSRDPKPVAGVAPAALSSPVSPRTPRPASPAAMPKVPILPVVPVLPAFAPVVAPAPVVVPVGSGVKTALPAPLPSNTPIVFSVQGGSTPSRPTLNAWKAAISQPGAATRAGTPPTTSMPPAAIIHASPQDSPRSIGAAADSKSVELQITPAATLAVANPSPVATMDTTFAGAGLEDLGDSPFQTYGNPAPPEISVSDFESALDEIGSVLDSIGR